MGICIIYSAVGLGWKYSLPERRHIKAYCRERGDGDTVQNTLLYSLILYYSELYSLLISFTVLYSTLL